MNIAIILASGKGSRIKDSTIPKQFIEINNKPIVGYTIDKFITNKKVDHIVVTINSEWIKYFKKYIDRNYKNHNIHIVIGGKNRNESIRNAIHFIHKELKANDNDIILTHDGVRPFTLDSTINANIEMCNKYDVVNTVVPTIDTIIESSNTKYVTKVLDRNVLYNVQTPQTFKYVLLKELFIGQNIIEDTTDLCQLISKKFNIESFLVKGEYDNLKVTTDFDLEYIKMKLSNQ